MVIDYLQLSDISVICRVVNLRRTLLKIWEGFLYGKQTVQIIVHGNINCCRVLFMLILNYL